MSLSSLMNNNTSNVHSLFWERLAILKSTNKLLYSDNKQFNFVGILSDYQMHLFIDPIKCNQTHCHKCIVRRL